MSENDFIHDFILTCTKDINLASNILRKHPEIISSYYSGVPILNYFVKKKNFEITKFLLENGFDPNIRNVFTKETPLSIAAINNDVQIGEILIKHGSDIYLESSQYGSMLNSFLCPFFSATKLGNIAFLDLLIKSGFNPFYRDSHGKGIEDYLPYNSDLKTKVVNFIKEIPLPSQFKSCDEKLKNPELTISEKTVTSLIEYCILKEFILAECIVKKYPDLRTSYVHSHFRETILNYFIYFKEEDVVEFLLKLGFNPNIRVEFADLTPLMFAIQRSNFSIFKLLLNFGADIKLVSSIELFSSKNDLTNENQFILHDSVCPYFLAAHYGKTQEMEALIQFGIDPFYKDNLGRSVKNFLPPIENLELREKVLKFLEDLKINKGDKDEF